MKKAPETAFNVKLRTEIAAGKNCVWKKVQMEKNSDNYFLRNFLRLKFFALNVWMISKLNGLRYPSLSFPILPYFESDYIKHQEVTCYVCFLSMLNTEKTDVCITLM